MGDTITVSCASSSIVLDLPSSAIEVLEFLRAYLEPYHRITGAPAVEPVLAEVHIEISQNDNASGEYEGATPIVVDRAENFMGCTADVREHGNQRWIRFHPSGVAMRVDMREHRVWVSAPSNASLLVPLTRLIDDVTLNHLERRGAVFVHAAAVVTPDGVVLIVGNKGSGKSSILCHSLRHFEVEQLANDNCILSLEEGEAVVRGWPGFFNVSLGTVAAYQELGDAFPPEHRHLLNSQEALWRKPEKVSLFAAEAAECFQARINPSGPLCAMVFSRFDNSRPPGVWPMDFREVKQEIAAFIQGSQHPNRPENWLGLQTVPRDTLIRNLLGILDAVQSEAHFYRLSWTTPLESLLNAIPELRCRNRSIRKSRASRPRQRSWPPLPLHVE